jgi:hypothetical protein
VAPIGFREEEVPSGAHWFQRRRGSREKKEIKTQCTFTHLWVSCFFCVLLISEKKNPTINSLEDHPMNISVKLVQIGPMVSGKNIIQL